MTELAYASHMAQKAGQRVYGGNSGSDLSSFILRPIWSDRPLRKCWIKLWAKLLGQL